MWITTCQFVDKCSEKFDLEHIVSIIQNVQHSGQNCSFLMFHMIIGIRDYSSTHRPTCIFHYTFHYLLVMVGRRNGWCEFISVFEAWRACFESHMHLVNLNLLTWWRKSKSIFHIDAQRFLLPINIALISVKIQKISWQSHLLHWNTLWKLIKSQI